MNIFVDGSHCPITGCAGIGITYKNISSPIRAKTSLAAEIIAIIRALLIARPGDVIYTDCRTAVDAFKLRRIIARHESLCVNAYSLYNNKCKEIKVMWIKRERNTIADELARRARKSIEKR